MLYNHLLIRLTGTAPRQGVRHIDICTEEISRTFRHCMSTSLSGAFYPVYSSKPIVLTLSPSQTVARRLSLRRDPPRHRDVWQLPR